MSDTLINNELRVVSAAVGTALDNAVTQPDTLSFPAGTEYLYLEGRNYSTAVVIKYALNPWLTVLLTTDNLDTAPTDGSDACQNNATSTALTLNSLSTLADGDYLLIGSHVPFRGVAVDVTNTNSNANSILVEYWNGSAWVDTSATDGTVSGGVSLAQDGLVTWTVPTTWATEALSSMARKAADTSAIEDGDAWEGLHRSLYWTRWSWSAALDSSVTIVQMHALNRSTAYTSLTSGRPGVGQFVRRGVLGFGSLEALTDAGTANLIAIAGSGRGWFG